NYSANCFRVKPRDSLGATSLGGIRPTIRKAKSSCRDNPGSTSGDAALLAPIALPFPPHFHLPVEPKSTEFQRANLRLASHSTSRDEHKRGMDDNRGRTHYVAAIQERKR